MSKNEMTIEKISYGIMKFAKFIFRFTIYIVVVFLIGSQLFKFGDRLFYERAIDEENPKTVEFIIADNDTTEDIAKKLFNSGLIDDELAFRFRAYIYKTNLTPGVYTLDTSMTIKNMLDIFDDAEKVTVTEETETGEDVQIETIVEGVTNNE